jgi:predicted Fe-S protein YdhL (DUF1289 family)
VPRRKASAYVSEISAVWKAMSNEEKENVLAGLMEESKDHCENKGSARHSIPIAAFQDTHATLNTME